MYLTSVRNKISLDKKFICSFRFFNKSHFLEFISKHVHAIYMNRISITVCPFIFTNFNAYTVACAFVNYYKTNIYEIKVPFILYIDIKTI